MGVNKSNWLYKKKTKPKKQTNKNKMSDKRRRRRKASDDSSGEEDEASITAVSFLTFFIYFISVKLQSFSYMNQERSH